MSIVLLNPLKICPQKMKWIVFSKPFQNLPIKSGMEYCYFKTLSKSAHKPFLIEFIEKTSIVLLNHFVIRLVIDFRINSIATWYFLIKLASKFYKNFQKASKCALSFMFLNENEFLFQIW